jgi:ferredoxin/nitroreductase
MPIPTSRTKENAEIQINEDLCTGCGLCVTACKAFVLALENKKAIETRSSMFGCFGCGHCMAICPTGAIKITGRELSHNDIFDLPKKELIPGYDPLLFLMQRRRSIRDYSPRSVEPEIIEKILNAAKTAPMGLPPSDVNVLVIAGCENTRAFAKEYSKYLKGMKYMASNLFLAIMRPFWGKENDELFKGFIKPVFKAYTDDMDEGKNYINYDAPLLMYFYGTPYSDPADPIIAATYAMIAGESLGLGTCMLGAVHPFIQNGPKARAFREKHNIKCKSREGLFVAFGYPAIKFRKGINRTFASVHYVGME